MNDEERARRLVEILMNMDLPDLRKLLQLWEEAADGPDWQKPVSKRTGKVRWEQPVSLAGLPLRDELSILREVLKIQSKRRR